MSDSRFVDILVQTNSGGIDQLIEERHMMSEQYHPRTIKILDEIIAVDFYNTLPLSPAKNPPLFDIEANGSI